MSRIDVTVGVKNAGFRSGLEEVRESARRFSSDIKSMFAGAFAAGAIVSGLRSVIEQGDRIGDLAARFRVSAEELQRLGMAGEVSGTSMETVARSMQRLRQSMAEAVTTGGAAREAFTAMGFTMEELQTLSTEEVYYRIADALANTTNETDKISMATAIFGSRLAGEMIPYLEQGSETLRSLGSSAGVMSSETIASLSQAADSIKQLEQTLTVAFGTIVGYVIMPFINAVKTLGAVYGGQIYAMTQVVGEFGRIMAMVFSGDFSGAANAIKQLGSFMVDTFRNAAQGVAEEIKTIWEKPEVSPQTRQNQQAQQAKAQVAEAAASAAKPDEEALRLEEQLAAEREKNERAKMDRMQKINALQEDYNRLLAEAESLSGKEKTKKLIQAERVKGELESEQRAQAAEEERAAERARREQEAEAKRQAEEQERQQRQAEEEKEKQERERQRQAEELAAAKQEEAEVDERNLIARMNPEQRREFFAKKQAGLLAEADEAEKRGDELTAVRKRTEAKRLQSEVDNLTGEEKDNRGVLTVSSLQRIGGGGGIANVADPAQRERERHTALLERIARAVEEKERSQQSTVAVMAM